MPKRHISEKAQDQELRDTSYGSRFGPRLIQSGEWITEDVFLEEIRDLTGEDEDVIRKIYDAYNDLILQHIALEDHINLPYATIGGHTKEPRKATFGWGVDDPTTGGYTNAKSGAPYFKWTEEALESTYIHPAIYFCEWVPQKYTTKAREFRKEVGYPEIPELAGLPEDKISIICAKADKALYGNRTRRQIMQARSQDKQKKKQQVGTIQATIEEAKAWMREIGIPEENIKIETYDDAQLVLQNRWRSMSIAIEIAKRRQLNRFHSKQWIEEQKRMREKMDKEKLKEVYARNDIFRLEDLPEETIDKMISVMKKEAIEKTNELFEEKSRYVSINARERFAKKKMEAIDRKLKDIDEVKNEILANREYRERVLEELYGKEYYHDIISTAMDELKDKKGDSIKHTQKAIAKQSADQDALRKKEKEEMEQSFFKENMDARIVDLNSMGYMTEGDKHRAQLLTNIYNSFIEKDQVNEANEVNIVEEIGENGNTRATVLNNISNISNTSKDLDDFEDDDLEDEEEELIAASPVPPTLPKRRGRPPGRKNTKTLLKEAGKLKDTKAIKTTKEKKTSLKKDA